MAGQVITTPVEVRRALDTTDRHIASSQPPPSAGARA